MKTETKTTTPDAPETGPRAFAIFLQKIADGDCHTQLSQELLALSQSIQVQAKAQAKTVKGTLTFKLSMAGDGNVLDVTYNIEKKEPKPLRPRSVFWQAKDGNVVDENQKQLPLMGVRDVSKRGPAKDAETDGGAARDA